MDELFQITTKVDTELRKQQITKIFIQYRDILQQTHAKLEQDGIIERVRKKAAGNKENG